jgi:hypothetical protein
MVFVVCLFNLAIALLCLYFTWQVWQWRRALAQATDVLVNCEISTHETLKGAPEAIRAGQQGTRQLRQQIQNLRPQIQQVNQVLSGVGAGLAFVQRRRLAQRAIARRGASRP